MRGKKIDWSVGHSDDDYCEVRLVIPEARAMLKEYLDWRFGEKAKWCKWYEEAVPWLESNDGKGLVLFGPHETGKSVFAADFFPALLRNTEERIIHPIPATIMNTPDALRHDAPFMYRYLKVIDGVGIEEKINEYGMRYEPFKKVVADSYTMHKFLIITTSYSMQDMYNRYGFETMKMLGEICTFINTGYHLVAKEDNEDKPIYEGP